MARRFVTDWFTGETAEVVDDSPGGRQIIARDSAGPTPTKHGSAYSRTFRSQTLAVPIEQIEEYNAAARRNGTGAEYLPMRDGQPYAEMCSDTRDSYKRELKSRGKVDFDSYV